MTTNRKSPRNRNGADRDLAPSFIAFDDCLPDFSTPFKPKCSPKIALGATPNNFHLLEDPLGAQLGNLSLRLLSC